MLNFLTPDNRRAVIKEYLSRDLVVLLVSLSLAVIVLIFLFIPSAIFSKYNNKTVNNQLESSRGASMSKSQDPTELIKKINTMVGILSDSKSSPILMSDMITKIISLKNKGILISNISISKDNKGTENISISGVAKTRDNLTEFNNDLKNDGTFSTVDLPISALIKNTNAQFSIKLVYNKK